MKPRLVEGTTSVLLGSVGDDLLVVELDPVFFRSTSLVIDADTVRFDGMSSIDRLLRVDEPRSGS
jgi:hypothetical protein